MTSQFPFQPAVKGNAKNFQRNNKVQVLIHGVWVDKTLPCGSKQVIDLAVQLMRIFGKENIKIVKVN